MEKIIAESKEIHAAAQNEERAAELLLPRADTLQSGR
jgi:hypothetical protein